MRDPKQAADAMGKPINRRRRGIHVLRTLQESGMKRDFESALAPVPGAPESPVQIAGPQSPKSNCLIFEIDLI
jgi:hypothetical protein